MTPATRASWSIKPPPKQREYFELALVFSDGNGERIRLGHVPSSMDDKWFIFFEDSWLYFHRSWHGSCIYGLRLDGSPGGVRVVEAWVSRDLAEYTSPGLEFDVGVITRMIDTYLLA